MTRERRDRQQKDKTTKIKVHSDNIIAVTERKEGEERDSVMPCKIENFRTVDRARRSMPLAIKNTAHTPHARMPACRT